MKRALAGVLVAAIVGLSAGGAMADAVPFIQVYFDDDSNGSFGETQANCGTADSPKSLYLVVLNGNAFVSAVDYQVSFPPAMMFLNDSYPVVPGGHLNIGDSSNGNAVSYGFPRSGFSPMLVVTINGLWTGVCDCAQGPQPLVVGGYPGKTSPSFVRWPDFVEFAAVGMTSLICPGPVATEETTWGGIKALYR